MKIAESLNATVPTALYSGPAAVWAYRRFGRPQSEHWLAEHHRDDAPDKPNWATYAVGVSHCGAGCTLGDIVGEFAIFGLAATVASKTLFAVFVGDYLLAVLLGLILRYFAIAPMRDLNFREGIIAAAKAIEATFRAPHSCHPQVGFGGDSDLRNQRAPPVVARTIARCRGKRRLA